MHITASSARPSKRGTAVSRTAQSKRRFLVVPALAAALALAGCAAGQITQTAGQVSAVSGGSGKIGEIDVLNVQFNSPSGTEYPKGSDAPLQVWVSNDGLDPDTLTGISSPVAASGAITGTAVAQAQSIEDFGTKYKVTLKGLTSPIQYGVSVPVTFSFKSAGSVTINVPVAIPGERTTGRPSIDMAPSESGSVWEPGEAAGEGG